MVHHVKDLSPNQRITIEGLLGRTLSDEESLMIRLARILKDAPVGDERARAFSRYHNHLDLLDDRVKDVPEDEIDAAIDEALQAVRPPAE
jgi:hypothetical protein